MYELRFQKRRRIDLCRKNFAVRPDFEDFFVVMVGQNFCGFVTHRLHPARSTQRPIKNPDHYSSFLPVFCPSCLVQSGNFSVVNQSFHLYFFGTLFKKSQRAKKLELFVHGSSCAFEISIRTLMRFHIR